MLDVHSQVFDSIGLDGTQTYQEPNCSLSIHPVKPVATSAAVLRGEYQHCHHHLVRQYPGSSTNVLEV